jgi:flagellar basal-body rod modification protein FlgD
MEGTFSKMADTLTSTQALQATSLVGKKVHVKADVGLYSQGTNLTGAIEIPQSVSDLTIEIRNEAGQVVKTYQINSAQKGDMNFAWDGLDENGNAAASGVYQIVAKATVDGQTKQFETYIASNVDSVTINKNGQPITLNVNGYGKVSIDDIKTIS